MSKFTDTTTSSFHEKFYNKINKLNSSKPLFLSCLGHFHLPFFKLFTFTNLLFCYLAQLVCQPVVPVVHVVPYEEQRTGTRVSQFSPSTASTFIVKEIVRK